MNLNGAKGSRYQDAFTTFQIDGSGRISAILVFECAMDSILIEEDEELLFSTVTFSLEGLNRWVGHQNITVDHSNLDEIEISVRRGVKQIIQINDTWILELSTPGYLSLQSFDEVRLNQTPVLKLSPKTALSITSHGLSRRTVGTHSTVWRERFYPELGTNGPILDHFR